MPDSRIIARVDAAGTRPVDGRLSRPLVAFVRDLTRYACGRGESDARRALRSPYSGVPPLDARALCVAAGERRAVAEAIAKERIPLGTASAHAARRFAQALDDLAQAYRAQGATAREHLATLRIAFAFDALDDRDSATLDDRDHDRATLDDRDRAMLDDRERATLDALDDAAARADAERAPGVAWDAATFVRTLEALGARDAALGARDALGDGETRDAYDETRDGARDRVARVPLAARIPETPQVVKRRRGHFSASSLGTFAQCERRWYYRYVCAAVEDRGSSASFYGTAFHWALEKFHEEFPRADASAPDLLQRKLDAYLATAFERFRSGFETTVEYELQRRRAKRTGRRYLAWLLERARVAPFEVVGTEATVELELDGYTFIGFIDRLDRDDATGAVTVVDYKTGSIAETADDYRAAVASFTDFQLPFYYWARTAAGDRVTRLSLVPLKDASREVRPIELEVVPVAAPRSYGDATTGTIGIDELERARAKMGAIAADLADGPIERFPVTTDPGECVYCAYQTACRERPLRREDRFGR